MIFILFARFLLGAGPIGMYSAFQLFMAGMEVTIVNDRPERYMRNRVIFLDPKWMTHLRFFLGTEFDEFFIGENSTADLNPGDVGLVCGRHLERVMKFRLSDLVSYVHYVSGADSKSKDLKLEFMFETSFEDVKYPNKAGRNL